jgi:hypothetical protein
MVARSLADADRKDVLCAAASQDLIHQPKGCPSERGAVTLGDGVTLVVERSLAGSRSSTRISKARL